MPAPSAAPGNSGRASPGWPRPIAHLIASKSCCVSIKITSEPPRSNPRICGVETLDEIVPRRLAILTSRRVGPTDPTTSAAPIRRFTICRQAFRAILRGDPINFLRPVRQVRFGKIIAAAIERVGFHRVASDLQERFVNGSDELWPAEVQNLRRIFMPEPVPLQIKRPRLEVGPHGPVEDTTRRRANSKNGIRALIR